MDAKHLAGTDEKGFVTDRKTGTEGDLPVMPQTSRPTSARV